MIIIATWVAFAVIVMVIDNWAIDFSTLPARSIRSVILASGLTALCAIVRLI